jgi:TetR/AcrR family transcriptional repressor of nem operon
MKGDKKQLTRTRIIDSAVRSFRANGYAGIGVDGIAKEAGVTSGAFYAHLGSKDGAFSAALSAGLDEVIVAIPNFQKQHGDTWLVAFVDYYLGQEHREDMACGCAMTTLSPEVARARADFQEIYEKKMLVIVGLIAEGLEGGSVEERESRAWSVLGVLIGGLTMARAVSSESEAENIASSIKIAAINVAGSVLCS